MRLQKSRSLILKKVNKRFRAGTQDVLSANNETVWLDCFLEMGQDNKFSAPPHVCREGKQSRRRTNLNSNPLPTWHGPDYYANCLSEFRKAWFLWWTENLGWLYMWWAQLLSSKQWGLTVQFLKLNSQTTHTNDLITVVKSCAELATLFGRTKCIELAHMVCCKIFKWPLLGLDFRVVLLIDLLPTKSPVYLTI